MARKSRKTVKNNLSVMPEMPVPKSKTGIYVRLSVEDNGKTAKNSIQNQIAYLEEYIRKNEDDFELVHIYIDNGITGTHFERPGWKKMMEDIKAGTVDCLVFKDFSRIGRNYIEVGNYLEKVFPFLGIRVVSVNDKFDSRLLPFEGNMLMNSLTNIANDYYAKDISRKTLKAKKTLQENGEYASGVYPYGYKRASSKKKLAVDTETADIVRKIFEWRTQGKSCPKIANYLNALAIPSPGLYRFMDGMQSFKRSSHSKWRSEHISGILTNPVYLGHLAQGKSQESHFKNNGKKKRMPKDSWIISENEHLPLVTQKQFDIAAGMAEQSLKKYHERMNANLGIPQVDNPLRKKIYCGQCGQKMVRRSRVTNGIRSYYYYCDSKRRFLGATCVQATIHETPLMETMQEVLQQQLQFYGSLSNTYQQQKKRIKNNPHSTMVKKQKEFPKKYFIQEIQKIKQIRKELYESLKDGLLTQESFRHRMEALMETQALYEKELETKEIGGNTEEKAFGIPKICQKNPLEPKKEKIPSGIMDILIKEIVIISPKQINITFSYADFLKNAAKQ